MRDAFVPTHFVAASFAGFRASLVDQKEGLSLLRAEEKLVGVLAVAAAAEY